MVNGLIKAGKIGTERNINILFLISVIFLMMSVFLSFSIGVIHILDPFKFSSKFIIISGGIGFCGLLSAGVLSVIFNPQVFTFRKFVILIIVTSLTAFLYRLFFSVVPMDLPDGYHNPAFRFIENGVFGLNRRSFPYPFLILLIISTFKCLTAVAVVQYLLGIFSGLLMVFVFVNVWDMFIKGRITIPQRSDALKYVLSLVILLISLFNMEGIKSELKLRPESISQFLLILDITLLIFIVRFRNPAFFGVIIVFNLFLIHFQVKFLFLSGFVTLFASILYFKTLIKSADKKRYLFFIITAVIVAVTSYGALRFAVSEWIVEDKNAVSVTNSSHLYLLHMNICNIEMRKDYDNPGFTGYDKKLLKIFMDFYDSKANLFNQNRNLISDEFNTMFYQSNEFPDMLDKSRYFLKSDKELDKFLKYYLFKSIMKNPLKYTGKVCFEFKRLLTGTFEFARLNKIYDIVDRFNYDKALSSMNERYSRAKSGIIKNYIADLHEILGEKIMRGVSVMVFNPFYKLLNLTYCPLFIFSVLSIIPCLCWLKDRNLNRLLLVNLFFYLMTIAFFLVTAMAYVFINRYILEAFPLTILSYFISAVYCVLFVRSFVMRLRNGVSA